ncbi:MAG TPA: addiction module protein [Bacillota bacterium]|nr:addiction module protein [Bacillota bacterium]
MSIGKIQAEVLKLHPSERARLAEALLLSLEELSDEENERLWAEKARRRHEDLVAGRASERIAADVFRDARGRLWL